MPKKLNRFRPCHVRIEIPNIDTPKKKIILFEVERELRQLGLEFDTGFDMLEQRRDWEFDGSLTGARVRFYRFK